MSETKADWESAWQASREGKLYAGDRSDEARACRSAFRCGYLAATDALSEGEIRRKAFIDVAAWLDGDCDMALAVRHIRCNVNDTDAPGDGTCLPLCCADCGGYGYVSVPIKNEAGEDDDQGERCHCTAAKGTP